MLREMQPTLLAEEIRIVRIGAEGDEPGASEYRKAA
jgi:hypothetical protein